MTERDIINSNIEKKDKKIDAFVQLITYKKKVEVTEPIKVQEESVNEHAYKNINFSKNK